MYRISIIIPCYNAEKYIDECMQSILKQTSGLENLEIILVDDASTDRTPEILKKYEQEYPENVMLILCEKNGRQGTARNIGLNYATGEYIAFVDADDWIHPDMFKVLQGLLEKTACDVIQFRGQDRKEYEAFKPLNGLKCNLRDVSGVEAKKAMLLNSEIWNEGCWCKIYKKELIDKSGARYAEGMTYEEPLFTYPLKFWANTVCNLDEVLYYHRHHEASVTFGYMKDPRTITEHLDVQLKVLEFMRNTEFYEEYKDEIDFYFLHTFFVEPFYFTKYRNMKLPVTLFEYMCDTVEKYVPDYENNPYFQNEMLKEEKKIMDLIGLAKGLTGTEEQKMIDEVQNGIAV